MLVISDTSPLNYLILIDAVDLLPRMYGHVIVPQAVADELSVARTLAKTRTWFASKPGWLEVRVAPALPSYPDLDMGEAQAIALAKTLNADLILVDERHAATIARDQEKLPTTGTLGVLLDAATLNLIDLPTALHTLQTQTTFHASTALLQQILDIYNNRTKPKS